MLIAAQDKAVSGLDAGGRYTPKASTMGSTNTIITVDVHCDGGANDADIWRATKMIDTDDISRHYAPGSLLADIEHGVITLCGATDKVTTEHLARVDEFHIGGRQASSDFLDQLDISAAHQVLDIGCGLGGAVSGCRCRRRRDRRPVTR